MTIKIEISDYSTSLELCEYKNGRDTSSKWNSVCPSVIHKVVNAKSAPSKSDIEGWVQDTKSKSNPKPQSSGIKVIDFWNDKGKN